MSNTVAVFLSERRYVVAQLVRATLPIGFPTVLSRLGVLERFESRQRAALMHAIPYVGLLRPPSLSQRLRDFKRRQFYRLLARNPARRGVPASIGVELAPLRSLLRFHWYQCDKFGWFQARQTLVDLVDAPYLAHHNIFLRPYGESFRS